MSEKRSETARESYHRRLAREHRERLEKIAAQVADGSLVSRHMSAEEREFWGPPKPVTRRRSKLSLAIPNHTDPDYVHSDPEQEEAA